MNIAENILFRFGFISEKQFTLKLSEAIKNEIDRTLPVWLGETADAERWTIPDISVYATQADMYRLSPILGTAVNILGNDVGTSKLNVKRMVGEETRDIKNHDFELLLRNPNPADSGIEFLQDTVSGYLLNGNSVWWCNRETQNDIPAEIWTIPFSMISPVPDQRLYIDHYEYFPGNGKTPMRLETFEIVHFKTYNPNSRFVGLSPLESLAVTLTGDQSMRRTNTVTYAKHGGVPPSILAFKEYPSNETWEDIKRNVSQSAKRDEMMMLRGVGDGVSWLQRAMSNKDADFLAGLTQNMTDVFNRMCPGLLNILSEGATYSNADAARATYSEMTKWPIMEVIAQKITSDILPAYGRKLVAQFEDPRFVDKQLTLQQRSADEKIMTVEELRKEYKQLDPFGDERDDLLLAQITAQTGKPAPEPAPVPPQLNTMPSNLQQPQMDTTPADETMQEDTALKADLMRWKRYSIRVFGKEHKDFESIHISAPLMRNINARLGACKSVGDVADVFENAIKAKHNPPVDGIRQLAAELNRAVDVAITQNAVAVRRL